MKITWEKIVPFEFIGTDEKENYSLVVLEIRSKFYWKVFRDEDKIIDGLFQDDDTATTADEAKARAEKALQDYLNEQNKFTNLLSEVMKPEETELEKEIDRLKFYYDKP